MSPCHVEEHVIPLPVTDEILAGVVHHSVRADRSDQVDVSRAADARHVRSKRLGDLHGEGATPPDAPLTKTFCPGRIWPLSRRPCKAVSPATGTAAACSNVRPTGFGTKFRSLPATYSAKAPLRMPNTSSPG